MAKADGTRAVRPHRIPTKGIIHERKTCHPSRDRRGPLPGVGALAERASGWGGGCGVTTTSASTSANYRSVRFCTSSLNRAWISPFEDVVGGAGYLTGCWAGVV